MRWLQQRRRGVAAWMVISAGAVPAACLSRATAPAPAPPRRADSPPHCWSSPAMGPTAPQRSDPLEAAVQRPADQRARGKTLGPNREFAPVPD